MSLQMHGTGVFRLVDSYRILKSSIWTIQLLPPSPRRPTRILNGKKSSSKLLTTTSTQTPLILTMLNIRLRTATFWIPVHLQILIALQRGFQRLRNLPGPTIGSIVANGILALVIGSVYYDLPESSNSMDKRALLIFLSTLLTALSPSFEVGKHRGFSKVASC